MNNVIPSAALALIIGVFLTRCGGPPLGAIAYPEPLPDSIPLSFLPGLVTTPELDFNSAFSPDGKDFYFCRSEHGNWVIYVTQFDGKNWMEPVHPSFNDTTYSEADPAFAPDGSLYYISNRPKNETDTVEDFDIWFVKPLGDNRWSLPENAPVINSDSSELYISFSANRNMYFSSSRPGGLGDLDLYMSEYKNGEYTEPENLGPAVNSPGSDHDPLIFAEEDKLVFTSLDRTDGYGQADLYYSVKTSTGWTPATNLGKRFNTPTYEYCSYLSPDGKYFFYSTDFDIKWISAAYLWDEMSGGARQK